MKIAASGALTGRAVDEWIGKTPDSVPPKSVVDRVFLRQNGKCAISKRKIMPSDARAVDHKKRLKDGGENRESNLQIILADKHKEKTAQENKDGAKATRIRLKHNRQWPEPKRKIPSRPFRARAMLKTIARQERIREEMDT